jgi:hypothetical protein
MGLLDIPSNDRMKICNSITYLCGLLQQSGQALHHHHQMRPWGLLLQAQGTHHHHSRQVGTAAAAAAAAVWLPWRLLVAGHGLIPSLLAAAAAGTGCCC